MAITCTLSVDWWQRLSQLVIAGLANDFPALRTLENRPTNLPIQPTTLIGRRREVAAATALLSRPDVRLLTLTGPGGSGKTRLGLQVAAELLEDFQQGVYLIPLETIAEPQQVLPTIAQTVGVNSPRDRRRRRARRTSGRRPPRPRPHAPEPSVGEFRRRTLAAAVGQTRVDGECDLRVRVPRERRDLGGAQAEFERDRDHRVPWVVDADRFEPFAVEPGGVARDVESAKRVAARLRQTAGGVNTSASARIRARLWPACRARCSCSSRLCASAAAILRPRPDRVYQDPATQNASMISRIPIRSCSHQSRLWP